MYDFLAKSRNHGYTGQSTLFSTGLNDVLT